MAVADGSNMEVADAGIMAPLLDRQRQVSSGAFISAAGSKSSEEEDRQAQVGELTELFQAVRGRRDGTISMDEFDGFLAVKVNALKAARCCRVPLCRVTDLTRMLFLVGPEVTKQEFVDCFVDDVSLGVLQAWRSIAHQLLVANLGQHQHHLKGRRHTSMFFFISPFHRTMVHILQYYSNVSFVVDARSQIVVSSDGTVVFPMKFTFFVFPVFALKAFLLMPFLPTLAAFRTVYNKQIHQGCSGWTCVLWAVLLPIAMLVSYFAVSALVVPFVLVKHSFSPVCVSHREGVCLYFVEIIAPFLFTTLFAILWTQRLLHYCVLEAVARDGLDDFEKGSQCHLKRPDVMVQLLTRFDEAFVPRKPLHPDDEYLVQFRDSLALRQVMQEPVTKLAQPARMLQPCCHDRRAAVAILVFSSLHALVPGLWRTYHTGLATFIPHKAGDFFSDRFDHKASMTLLAVAYCFFAFQGSSDVLFYLLGRHHTSQRLHNKIALFLFNAGTSDTRRLMLKKAGLHDASLHMKGTLREQRVVTQEEHLQKRLESVFGDQYPFQTLSLRNFTLLRYYFRLETCVEHCLLQCSFVLALLSSVLSVCLVIFVLHMFQSKILSPSGLVLFGDAFVALLVGLVTFNDAITLNTLLLPQTLYMLANWKDRILWLRWTLLDEKDFYCDALSDRRMKVESFFSQLVGEVGDAMERVTARDRPLCFFGMPIDSALRTKILTIAAPVVCSLAVHAALNTQLMKDTFSEITEEFQSAQNVTSQPALI